MLMESHAFLSLPCSPQFCYFGQYTSQGMIVAQVLREQTPEVQNGENMEAIKKEKG